MSVSPKVATMTTAIAYAKRGKNRNIISFQRVKPDTARAWKGFGARRSNRRQPIRTAATMPVATQIVTIWDSKSLTALTLRAGRSETDNFGARFGPGT
jgi:hypothetical protein